MLADLGWLQYWDEFLAAILCWWCLHRVQYMQFSKTACVDVLAICLIGAGSITHAVSPFYGPQLDGNFGDPLLWTGLFLWLVVPGLRRWAVAKHHARIEKILTRKAM